MKETKVNLLEKSFPNLYREGLGTGVQDGWFDLIYDLSSSIEKLILKEPEDERESYHVIQVKEKFGGLRFYMNRTTERMAELISEAERRSHYVCEKTGNPGRRLNVCGWIKTLSPEAFVSEMISRRNWEMYSALKRLAENQLDEPNDEGVVIDRREFEWAQKTLKRWQEIDQMMKKFCEQEGIFYH